jgi:synaptojanin
MHLLAGDGPRTLYLVTTSQEERLARPPRVLLFRAPDNVSNQVVVEFLSKDDVDLSQTVRLTSKSVQGCLGLIGIQGGV